MHNFIYLFHNSLGWSCTFLLCQHWNLRMPPLVIKSLRNAMFCHWWGLATLFHLRKYPQPGKFFSHYQGRVVLQPRSYRNCNSDTPLHHNVRLESSLCCRSSPGLCQPLKNETNHGVEKQSQPGLLLHGAGLLMYCWQHGKI